MVDTAVCVTVTVSVEGDCGREQGHEQADDECAAEQRDCESSDDAPVPLFHREKLARPAAGCDRGYPDRNA